MASSKLIILSLLFLPLSLLAENASDYANRGAQKYIFGHEDLAKAEIEEGLKKFPNDPELQQMRGLFHEKKPPEKNDDQKKKDQQNSPQQDQQKDSGGDKNQNPKNNQPSPTPSPGNDEQQNGPGESPTPTPGSSPPAEESPTPGEGTASPTATPGEEGIPSPTPGSGNDNGDNNGEHPSPSPAGTPDKLLTGEVKGAGDEKPKETPAAQVAEAEPEKEGEMSPKQAAALLESMKDEEEKVQLDEHKRVRPVYNDW